MNTSSLSIPQNSVHIGAYEHAQPDEIVLCKGDSNYTHVHFADGRKLTVATTLKIIQERLNAQSFVRVNRSGLINKDHIAHYDRDEITLTNGTKLPIARRRRQAVQQFIQSCAEMFGKQEMGYA
ncbi:LytR/AlgR family response regulator transcription factor [Persicitalea sp.]|uniref:LytR/AlgR family response regulator transcription factor n=1 Tax=Persicitalea sp. TaxID=3100273 RepID=UPI0035936D1C